MKPLAAGNRQRSAFAARLEFVLKALSLTRGRLAADLGVDKSLVGRWASGAVRPSAYNLERLTQLIAHRKPGFTLLDWDHDLDRLAQALGVSPPAQVGGPANPHGIGIGGRMIPESMERESALTTSLRGSAYEGFWRTTRPSAELPGQFVHDQVMIRRSSDSLLILTLGVFSLRFSGWAVLLQNKIFSVAVDTDTDTFIFTIFHGVQQSRADVLDGLSLTCLRDSGGTPVAGTVLMDRIGALSGDIAADDAHFDMLCSGNPVAPPGSIAPDVAAHLFRDVGPRALAEGGDALLLMHYARSMARGPLFDFPSGS